MSPIPCAHCGINYMRHSNDPLVPKLCNSCELKEERKNPKREKDMSVISIWVKVPLDMHNEIEELCINEGIGFSEYFIRLHTAVTAQEDSKEVEETKKKGKGSKK